MKKLHQEWVERLADDYLLDEILTVLEVRYLDRFNRRRDILKTKKLPLVTNEELSRYLLEIQQTERLLTSVLAIRRELKRK